MSPERPNSPQDEIPVTPKMSAPGSPVAGTPLRDAQSPISMLLAVAQSQNTKSGDDDLTSLSWLHENDVLKGMNINPSPSGSTSSSPAKNGHGFLQDQSPTSDYQDESSASATDSPNGSVNSPSPSAPSPYSGIAQYQAGTQRVRHPHNIPYDPLVHTNNKPPYSFSCLIFMAIEDSKQKALPVKEIYAWILEHFPYFKNAPTGWKNSVRHNLSLNKCFQKVEKAPNLGKGSLWTVDPHYKPNLIQALNRSPFHPSPGSIVDPTLYYAKAQQSSTPADAKSSHRIPTLPNPELFPYLSKKLAATEMYGNGQHQNVKIESKESLDAVDAAAVMLSLKNATRLNGSIKKEKNNLYQVITTSPSQDHTYSAADSTENGDEAFESDEDRHSKTKTCRKIDFEDEEERRIKEGAETLLNLAGIATRKRLSQYNNVENGKKVKSEPEGNFDDGKHMPFKPRLLRVKKKENSAKVVNNNDWVKYRKELDINQTR